MAVKKVAFLAHYVRFKDKIYSYFWYRTGMQKELAEDLTQEIFLKAWNKFSTFDTNQSFQAWIYRIAHNHLVDYYRGRKVELGEEELINHGVSDKQSWQLWQMLDELPEEERELVSLKYLQGFSYREIAEILETTEGSARVTVHRIMKKLQAKHQD